MNFCICGKFIFDKDAYTSQWGKSVFNKWCCKNWVPTCRRMKLHLSITPYTNSKWAKDKNIKANTITFLEVYVYMYVYVYIYIHAYNLLLLISFTVGTVEALYTLPPNFAEIPFYKRGNRYQRR